MALVFYYPFDLIKTRMQTSNDTYKYRNVTDAFYKIFKEPDSDATRPFLQRMASRV